jgi:general secretion pathway protein L
VILEFPTDKVVTRQITVPGQARKFLAGVIRNQIERLSPWPANAVVYGFAVDAADSEAANVNVRILMASRADIDLAAQDLAVLGLSVDRIVARGSDTEAAGDPAGPVTLWSRLADTSPHRLGRAARAISIGIAAAVTAFILLSSWAFVSAASIQSDSEDIAARSRTLQRDMQAGRTASSTASSPPAERAWNLKDLSTSSVVLIEALSRALPDSAYLSEIQLEKERLRITGLADDAPALLAPLQRSGYVTDVHFFAPTTRGPDGRSFRFSIEAHVEPRIKIGED